MFKALGALVALYLAYAVMTGEIYAKAGPVGRKISRDESPRAFWAAVGAYGCLALMLVFLF